MVITTTDGALEAARLNRFMEAKFTPEDDTRMPRPEGGAETVFDLWGRECDAGGRHGVIVGELSNGRFFVLLILRSVTTEMRDPVQGFRGVFRRHFGDEPRVDDDPPEEETWVSPETSRATALAAACELVAIDSVGHQEDHEVSQGSYDTAG